jgi:Ca2+-binding EF-hand superfamily protein
MVAALFATGVSSRASDGPKSGLGTPAVTAPTDTRTAVQPQVEQLLLVIGENQHGQVTKEEFLQFMQAEFAKIDKQNSGAIKCADLEKSGVGVVPAAKMGR